MRRIEWSKERHVLTPEELELLTDTWAIWVEEAPTQMRRVARRRLHLFFLLARFGGMRLSEITGFDLTSCLDSTTGLLRINDRHIFLPGIAMRQLRLIIGLEEAKKPDFTRLDGGFLRRTFYDMGERANLPPALCAPRALRYGRAAELLAMSMSLEHVAKTLDFKNTLHVARFLQIPERLAKKKTPENYFTALVTRFDVSVHSAKLYFELSPNIELYCICSIGALYDAEPIIGNAIEVYIPPGAIYPAELFTECLNPLTGKLLAISADQFELRLNVALNARLRLAAVMDRNIANYLKCETQKNINLCIPPHLIQINSTEL